MIYTNDNRGVIQNRERARQIIDFSGVRYNNITPTDIDGFFEKANTAFVFYELKYGEAEMPRGQEAALTRLVDNLQIAGKKAVLFLGRHNVANTQDDVPAADVEITKIYFNGSWVDGNGETLKTLTDRFMKWAIPF